MVNAPTDRLMIQFDVMIWTKDAKILDNLGAS